MGVGAHPTATTGSPLAQEAAGPQPSAVQEASSCQSNGVHILRAHIADRLDSTVLQECHKRSDHSATTGSLVHEKDGNRSGVGLLLAAEDLSKRMPVC